MKQVVTVFTCTNKVVGVEDAIRRKCRQMQYDPGFINKRTTFSVYRFSETDTYLICLSTLDPKLQTDMNVQVYREHIMPYYKPVLVED